MSYVGKWVRITLLLIILAPPPHTQKKNQPMALCTFILIYVKSQGTDERGKLRYYAKLIVRPQFLIIIIDVIVSRPRRVYNNNNKCSIPPKRLSGREKHGWRV